MKYVLPAISIILLLIIVGGTAFYFGQTSTKTSPVLPTPTLSQQTSADNQTLTSTPVITTRTIPAGGVLTYAAYTIDIPTDWTYTKDDGKDIDTLIIMKGNYRMQILQGGMGGAMCLYPGDADVEGPSSRFTNFVEIMNPNGYLLRRGYAGPQGAIGVCEKQKFGWEQPTSFGAISYLVPDRNPQIIQTMDAMLASLKKK
jgi:hypothetical protein